MPAQLRHSQGAISRAPSRPQHRASRPAAYEFTLTVADFAPDFFFFARLGDFVRVVVVTVDDVFGEPDDFFLAADARAFLTIAAPTAVVTAAPTTAAMMPAVRVFAAAPTALTILPVVDGRDEEEEAFDFMGVMMMFEAIDISQGRKFPGMKRFCSLSVQ